MCYTKGYEIKLLDVRAVSVYTYVIWQNGSTGGRRDLKYTGNGPSMGMRGAYG